MRDVAKQTAATVHGEDPADVDAAEDSSTAVEKTASALYFIIFIDKTDLYYYCTIVKILK